MEQVAQVTPQVTHAEVPESQYLVVGHSQKPVVELTICVPDGQVAQAVLLVQVKQEE